MHLSFDEVQDGFVKGLYAMHFSGPFLRNELKQRWGNEWDRYFGISQIPGHYTFVGGSHLGIYRNSSSIPEALEFLRFLTTDQKAQTKYASIISQLPALGLALQGLQNTPGCDVFLHFPTWRTYPFHHRWFEIEREPPGKINGGIRGRIIEIIIHIISFLKRHPYISSGIISGTVSFLLGKVLGKYIKGKIFVFILIGLVVVVLFSFILLMTAFA